MSLPRVTIVIPAFNEEDRIAACVEGLRKIDYPAELTEVVVVDNASTDGTAEAVRRSGARLLFLEEGKVGAVRNHGVRETDGEVVAFIDADCIALTTWLRGAVKVLQDDSSTVAVGGKYLAPPTCTWMEAAWASVPDDRVAEVDALAGGSFVVRRTQFEEVGGFDESLNAGEDFELSHRLRELGGRILRVPECGVYHHGWPRTPWEVVRRQYWQGSNQLEATRGRLDLTVVAVHLFLFAVLGLVLAPFLAEPLRPTLLVASIGLALAIPASTAIRRARNEGARGRSGVRLARLWVIYFWYFVGRAAGLCTNYFNRLLGRSPKIGK